MEEFYKYILPPLIGAFIGWLTNYIAIKLLFRPLEPLKILGYTFQGLIPKRKKELAANIAHAIENELLNSRDLASVLESMDWKEDIEKAVEEVIEHRVGSKFKGIPLVGLVSENLTYHVKYLITKDILEQFERKKAGLAKKMTESVDVKGMLSAKIDSLDLMKFEGLLTSMIAKELRHLEWLGAVMGFIIGILQSLIFYIFA